jgi:hypothetical protein
MNRKLIILGVGIVSLAIGTIVYQQSASNNPTKKLSVTADDLPSVQATAPQNTECADDSYAWQRVRELEAEISRLKQTLPSTTAHEIPSSDTSVTAAPDADPGSEVATPAHATPQPPAAVSSGTVAPHLESEIVKSTNNEDEDRAILKKLDLPNPNASMAAARRVPDEKVQQLQGGYQGRLFFTKGSVGSLEVFFNLEDFGGKPVGTLSARIINEEGKTISKTRGEGDSVELKKVDGSNALLLRLSPFEIIQIFVKDDKTNLVGNYYERPKEDAPLKKSAEFIISKVN